MLRQSVRSRLSWSEKMIADLLLCKTNALSAVKGSNPPLKTNGRRFGYVEYMHKLWTEMGYEHLNLTSQNLSDQARRVERKQTEILSSVSETIDEQRNIVIITPELTVKANVIEVTLSDSSNEIPIVPLNDVRKNVTDLLNNPLNDTPPNDIDKDKLNQLVKGACEIYNVISIIKGDFSKREYTTRLRTTPKAVDILYMNYACKGLIQTYDLQHVDETYLKLWLINCIVYSVINAWIKVNNIKGMECTRKVKRGTKNSYNTIPACVKVVDEEIKTVRSRLSKCCSELDRLKTKRRMTRRTKRNRAEMEKEVGVITHHSLVCYIQKLKKRLSYLAKKRKRKLRNEKSRKLNAEFQKDQKTIFDKFRSCIEDDPENLKPVYEEKVVEKKYFENAEVVENFWRTLWEQPDSGNPEVPWLKEIEEKFKQIIPDVDEGDLDVTNEICWETIRKKKNWSAPGPDKITNFWWKKLTYVIKFISSVFRAICNVLLIIERWVCTGRVSLLPKPGDWSESNQRPITCLNTIYKWITSVLRYFHNDHIKKYELLQIDQRGVKQKSSGTMCNLLVDDMVLRDAKLYHRNLFCYWIDVRKAFDSVSHSWLIKMLEIHRFPSKLIQLFTSIMSNWGVKISIPVKDGYVESSEISIVNGILQGDSYCPDLYVLAINVQSWTIRTSEGYMLHAPISEKITHTLYIDDLKGYTNTLRKLTIMLNLVKERMEDAGLIWNPKKCKFMAMKRGKFASVDNISLRDGSIIKCLGEDEMYEFMGIPQRLKMDDISLGQDLLKTVKQRSHIVWSSGLSDMNKVKASNVFVNSLVEYYFWAVKFTIETIRTFDAAVRENMNSTGSKPTHQMNVINYLPRTRGGRGLRCMETTYKATKIKLAIKLLDEKDQRVTLVKRFHLASKETSSFSIFKDAERYAAELDLEIKFDESEVTVVDKAKGEVSEVSLIQLIKSKSFDKNWSELLSSTWQGVNTKQRVQDEDVKKGYFLWMQKWTTCPTEVVHEFILFFYQMLPTLKYKSTRSNEVIEDTRCRICHKGEESVKHLISNCGEFAKSLYFARHDNALKCFVWQLLYKFNLSEKCPNWFANDKVAPHYSKDNVDFWWDVPEYTGRDEESKDPPRPDAKLIIDREEDKRIYLIEMTVPWTGNRREKFLYKSTKYEPILQALKFEYPNHIVDQITVVMDVFGGYGQDLEDNIGKIFKEKEDVRTIIKNMQKSVVSNIVSLSRTFKIRSGLNIN